MQTCDVAIVGAGIVGAACAYELSNAGLRVVVVDPNAVGSGGTNLGYGSLSLQDEIPGQLALTRYGLQLWDRFVGFLPQDCDYRRCGTLWVATNELLWKSVVRRRQALRDQGVSVDLLDRQQISEAEPGISENVVGGLLVESDGCLRASRAAEFLFQLAFKKGAKYLHQRAINFHNHELTLDDGSLLYAGNLLNAAGCDAGSVTPDCSLNFSKGHVLVVETRGLCASHQIFAIEKEALSDIEGQIQFALRQNPGVSNLPSEVWIGSSQQTVAQPSGNSQVEPKVIAHLLRRAIEMVPEIGSAKPLRSWIGVRATVKDGLPYIGRIPSRDGVFVAAGHAASGATTALATARLIADELLCQTPEIDPSPYRPDRFEGTKSNHAK